MFLRFLKVFQQKQKCEFLSLVAFRNRSFTKIGLNCASEELPFYS